MTITKNLDWFPAFPNEITIEYGDFLITMKSNTSELEIDYHEDYDGYNAVGRGCMIVDMELLMELRAELNASVAPRLTLASPQPSLSLTSVTPRLALVSPQPRLSSLTPQPRRASTSPRLNLAAPVTP